ncbi:MAG: succinyl-diaminopimelate desuccinylase [Gammaproteobacteria bacterium]|jgi:succinyl-diaminopimelate desuccinylase|nr:succinyl-diaminopimelate desuccinylase [Gammaproteobacteria bacterium]MBT7603986.1 succinyl-diaminopimelate desuccinylase [Gammaproteobacteria bacterium]
MENNLEKILINLIEKKSITPNDDGCQEYIKNQLLDYNFLYENLNFENVKNSWLRKGEKEPLLVFAGHTDVVPPGNLKEWKTDPFKPEIIDNILYGRGASDMKSSIAAMISASQRFIKDNPDHNGSIGFLLTSDEEGPAKFGTKKVIEKLKKDNININYCLVGEPTSSKKFGDTIKNGRRGSISGLLKLYGIQGHIAYPELAKNPIHYSGILIEKLIKHKWDNGNKYFPATSFQISSIMSDSVATNMIPASVTIKFNLRFSNELNENKIKNSFEKIISNIDCKYKINWDCSANPFITNEGKLTEILQKVIKNTVNQNAALSTSGGTSDARFISQHANETIEFGPLNTSAHKVDENINIEDLYNLENIYYGVLCELLL